MSFHNDRRVGTLRRTVTGVVSMFAVLLSPFGGVVGQNCDRRNSSDVDDIAAGRSADCNGNGLPDECELMPLRLSLLEGDLELGGNPRGLVIVDLDGDGRSDLISLEDDGERSSVGVLRSRGDGTFTAAESFPAGAAAVAAVALDWNRDGAMDLAITGSDAVHVLLGDGVAPGKALEITRPGGAVVVAADLAGEGSSDLVVAGAGSVSVLRAVTGAPVERTVVEMSLASPAAAVVIDLDGDGALDVAVVGRAEETVTVLYGGGDGTLLPERRFDLKGEGGLGSRPHAVTGGDLDGDGDQDLVVGLRSTVVFLRSEGRDFAPPEGAPSGGPLTSLVLGDFDSDEDLDLLTATSLSNDIDVWQNAGEGPRFDTGSLAAGWSPRRLTTGDFDADGRLDVAAVVGNAEVARAVVLVGDRGAVPADLLFQVSSVRVTGKPHSITMGDFDGDGFLDVTTCNGGQGSFSVLFGTAAGELLVSRTYQPPERVALFTITNGDLDGDGDLDVAAGDAWADQAVVRTNAGDGTFFEMSFPALGAAPTLLTTGDLDGDGRVDLISANSAAGTVSFALGTGGGVFETPRQIRVGSRPLAVIAHDLDSDGDEDLAVASANARELAVLLNRGDGTFAPGTSYPVLGAARHVVASDLDADGRADLFVAHDSWVTVFRNQGDGRFVEEITVDTRQAPYSLLVTDLDSDGVLDIVASNTIHPSYGTLSVFLGQGKRDYEQPFRLVVGAEPRFAVAGDVDQDGDIDLVTANRTSENVTMLRNEQSTFPDVSRSICTPLEFYKLVGGDERVVRFLIAVPVTASLSEPFFQNTARYGSHVEFLRTVLPEQVAGLSDEEVDARLRGGEGARYVAGSLRRLPAEGYGFDLLSENTPLAAPAADTVGAVYDALRGAFHLEALGYAPLSQRDQEVTRQWRDVAFPIFLPRLPAAFRRGDANADGRSNVADVVTVVDYHFLGTTAPPCLKSVDINDDGRINIADAIGLLTYLYRGGSPPASPHPGCGPDPTADTLSCEMFGPCSS